MMQLDLGGRIAIVTGAAQGISRAIAQGLAASGARVLALDRNEAGLSAADGIETAVVDVTDAAVIAAALERMGMVDTLVHSAGGVCG